MRGFSLFSTTNGTGCVLDPLLKMTTCAKINSDCGNPVRKLWSAGKIARQHGGQMEAD